MANDWGAYSRELRKFLRSRNSPLAPMAGYIAATEKRYGLPRGLLAGISAAESTYGTNPTVAGKVAAYKNAWGWGPWIKFPSWKVAINSIAKGLATNYIAKGLTTPLEIGEKYAPSSDGNNPGHWASTVSETMSRFGGGVAGAPGLGGGGLGAPGMPGQPLRLTAPRPIKIGPKTKISQGTAYSMAAQLAQARLTGDSQYIVGAMKELYQATAPPKAPSATEVNNLQRAQQLGIEMGEGMTGEVGETEMKAVNLVKEYLGTPYVWGGEQPGGFDCSGLLQYVWGKLGVKIPRVTYDQIKAGKGVKKNQLQPGDAVFFGSAGDPHHVGMYIGNGKFIEAPFTGGVVRVSKLSSRDDFLAARRFA